MTRLLTIVLFFDVGLVLLVLPWRPYWEENYFFEAVPLLKQVFTNPYVRGAVSGLGLVNLLAGAAELVGPLFSRRSGPPPPDVSPDPHGTRYSSTR